MYAHARTCAQKLAMQHLPDMNEHIQQYAMYTWRGHSRRNTETNEHVVTSDHETASVHKSGGRLNRA